MKPGGVSIECPGHTAHPVCGCSHPIILPAHVLSLLSVNKRACQEVVASCLWCLPACRGGEMFSRCISLWCRAVWVQAVQLELVSSLDA